MDENFNYLKSKLINKGLHNNGGPFKKTFIRLGRISISICEISTSYNWWKTVHTSVVCYYLLQASNLLDLLKKNLTNYIPLKVKFFSIHCKLERTVMAYSTQLMLFWSRVLDFLSSINKYCTFSFEWPMSRTLELF